MNGFSSRLGLALVISLIAVACAAPAAPVDTGSGEQEANPTTPAPAKTPASTPAKTPTSGSTTADPNAPAPDPNAPAPDPNAPAPDPNAPAGNCGATADFDACFVCCDAASAGELMKSEQVYETCMNGGGNDATCGQQADASCVSAGCQAALQCLDTSCADKP